MKWRLVINAINTWKRAEYWFTISRKTFYRVSNASGYYKDFETLNEVQSLIKYDFFNYYTVYKVIQILDDFGKITDTMLIKV